MKLSKSISKNFVEQAFGLRIYLRKSAGLLYKVSSFCWPVLFCCALKTPARP